MTSAILVILGTRPEAIKLAPVIQSLEQRAELRTVVVHTGQHRELIEPILQDFGIGPDHDLSLMTQGQSLCGFGAALLRELPRVFEVEKPSFAVVQGDTGTALFAAQACFFNQIPVGHVEAGLRTGDLQAPFPEEGNRAMISRIARLHFAPTATSRNHLAAENICMDWVRVTGNPVIDSLQREIGRQRAEISLRASVDDVLTPLLGSDWREHPSVLITGHRRENFGVGFANICGAIRELAHRHSDYRFIYPVHLNPNVRDTVHEVLGEIENVFLLPPLSYRPFVGLLDACRLVLSDSGGIQEEAPSLGKPVLVMRDTTERPEGIQAGTVKLVGSDSEEIVGATSTLLTDPRVYESMSNAQNPYGDGKSGDRIAELIADYVGQPT